MRLIKPSLRELSEEQVLKALASGDDDNLILQELGALISRYLREYSRLEAAGEDAEALLDREPSCPLDDIALIMVAAALKAEKD